MNSSTNLSQMNKKNRYTYEELIDCANGKLFGPGNAKLPSPPMLMFDRITDIQNEKGKFSKGLVEAELDINEKMWFFDCHFKEDPVMPGCLGLDAMWQLVGFYLGWVGEPGKGRALGVNNVKFTGEVLKSVKIARYQVNMKRILKKEGAVVGLADGILFADNKQIYEAEGLKVGLFKS
jgi:3-hydroxyacyl-[acyl-carrier protein] dehydratase/trans-2-decenoyl-[acyl-carrier protein] isomerase